MPEVTGNFIHCNIKYTATLLFSTQGVSMNCGAMLANSFRLTLKEEKAKVDSWGIGSGRHVSSKEMALVALDALKDKIVYYFEDCCKGMCILTDNVKRTNVPLWEEEIPGVKTCFTFTTGFFAQWLISRKVGYVGRGITTVNIVHPGDSVLTSWVWAPSKSWMLSMEQPLYEGDLPPDKTSACGKIATAYNAKEKALRSARNVKKASVPERKRAG